MIPLTSKVFGVLASCRSIGAVPRVSPSTSGFAFVRRGEWSEALRFLEEMKVAGVEPDLFTFNAAISAVGASGQCDLALGLLEEMKTAGFKPDTVRESRSKWMP